jgi:nicotinamide-nucleotide amidase
MTTAILITIGDEILSGSTVDTNSNFIAGQLKAIGILVKEIMTISDAVTTIENTFFQALKNTDVVIATGGLGPTKDDKTKKALANIFQDEMVLDNTTYQHLKNYLTKKNRADILEINKSQAEIPSRAIVFQNDYGTAPALLMTKDQKMVFCLPGVPYEVKPLMKDKIIPFLQKKYSTNYILSKTITIVGLPESILSEKIEKWELSLPPNMQLSYLPVAYRIKLKLTAKGFDKTELENSLNNQILKLKPLVEKNVISWDGEDIEEILGNILKQKKWTISVAESCTGGEIARLITSIAGSSNYFVGGIVAYDYHQKIKILGVAPETIANHTVVSPEVALEMAKGCKELFSTDIAISTTGVAGPGTDEFQNEIGKICYTISIKNQVFTKCISFPYLERKDFMNFVSLIILQELVKKIVELDTQ